MYGLIRFLELVLTIVPTILFLGLFLIVLKLVGVIALAWLWVTLPFWGSIALVLLIALLIALIE